jgi:prophage DNA circulation protein
MIFDTAQTGINTVVRSGLDVGLNGNSTSTSWRDQLQPASFGGVPFGVLGGDAHFGRKNAVHEYPFRDGVWVEDLGRSGRRINLSGFLVGDDCIAQRARLIKVCEAAGSNELVHPTLGRMSVNLAQPVSIAERWDHGRVFELKFSFVEAGQRIFPTTQANTSDAVTAAAAAADSAAGVDFATNAASALRQGAAVVNQAVTTAAVFYRKAQRISNDATNLVNLAKSLPGEFGRFAAGARLALDPFATAASVKGQQAAALQGVGTASATMGAAAANLSTTTTDAFVVSSQALVASVQGISADPTDSLRLLGGVADFTPAPLTDASPIGSAMDAIQTASANLFRRAVVVALARTSASYQPFSQDDAVTVRAQVTGLLDDEILLAADSGDNGSYASLRAVRAAVVQDLNVRSIGLPALVTINTNLPLSALALAQRLYRDATRTDELIARARPIHPAFLPVSFKALSA